MPIDSGNLALKGLDDLFSTEENRQEEQREQVQQIPIDALHPFTNHPFKVLDDEAMTRTVESIAQYGVLAPLIATTNLTLEELQHPQDTPHARIYDRLTSMCAPVRFTGSNFRKETAQEKLERLKQLMKQRKESL